MNNLLPAIQKLQYHVKSETQSLNRYKEECRELNSLFSLDSETYSQFEDEQLEVINNYEKSIQSYKEALEVLQNM